MIEKLIRKFAVENFGDEEGSLYFPVYHGKIQEIKPLVLLAKDTRSIWKRPFKKNELTVLAEMDTYVVDNKKEEFQVAVKENIKKEDCNVILQDEDEDEEDSEGARSEFDLEAQVAQCLNAKIKINEELGHLELGKLDQEYMRDPELRDILASTKLNSVKTETFEGRKLRLITSVVYSQRFAVKGHREWQVEAGARAEIPTNVLAQLKGHLKRRVIPPRMATRYTRGPFLFTCCRVVHNKETNQLELAEVVGKKVRSEETVEEETKEEYKNTAVDLEEEEQSDLADDYEDGKKWDKIINCVLKPTVNREERKARVNKYLQWFESALTAENQTLSFDKPLTEEDCQFLRSIYLRCHIGDREMKLPESFDEDKIQGYAIVLKKTAGLSDKDWDEVEKAWAKGA